MRHMMHENLALNTMRQTKMREWRHAVVSNLMAPAVYVEIKDGCNQFPLYLYPQRDVLSGKEAMAHKRPNLDPSLIRGLQQAYGGKPTPEEVFCYIYAILYAPSYRTKFNELLKRDFPRVPFTRDRELFGKLADLGRRLVDLHLLRSSTLNPPVARFEETGDNKVERQMYSPKDMRVYINETQYFDGVSHEAWLYHIGGYQILDKWLKDRKGRALSLEDIRHYCRVVTAIAKTIEIQEGIEALYPDAESDILLVETSRGVEGRS